MGQVYVTSDWHLGHLSIKRWEPNGLDIEERTGRLLENYCSMINKRDIVWFLGDMCFSTEAMQLMSKLVGDKRLILGNHDTERMPIEQFILTFDQVHGLVSYKRSWLSHSPVHPDELRGLFNVHGHVHQNSLKDPRYFNACPEVNDYKPVKYQDILGRVSGY
jgi:calcineurin-like phosphoesterase family protein